MTRVNDRCKFCGKTITTDHYYITKSGAVCIDCQKQTRKYMKMFGIKKENEILIGDSTDADSSTDNDGSLRKKASRC